MHNAILKVLQTLLIILTLTFAVQGQDVEIKHTDVFKSVVIDGEVVNKFLGNVRLKRNNARVTCDSAYQYLERKNSLKMMGKVKLVRGDTLFLDCDRVYFDGEEEFLTASGNVFLRDPSITIKTDKLYYSGTGQLVYYNEGGQIFMPSYNITSKKAYYHLNSSFIHFTDSVRGWSSQDSLESDSLNYFTKSKKVEFLGPTFIRSDRGNLRTSKGEYLTKEKKAYLVSRSMIEDSSYLIWGDTLIYDQMSKDGEGYGNISLFSKKEQILLLGQGFMNEGNANFSKVWGDPIVRWETGKDTLWVSSDTLVRQRVDGKGVLRCFNNVSFFRNDLQGICDSMIYDQGDSSIIFYKDPVLWTGGNQMSSDTIIAKLKDNRLDKMYLNRKAFVINQDSLGNFNQIKGRYMDASFDSLGISLIDIEGNGESIYFVTKEEDGSVVGMNRVWCSNMVMDFEANKLKDIHFLVRPDAKFIPPHEWMEPEMVLRGFNWREEERPLKEQFKERTGNDSQKL